MRCDRKSWFRLHGIKLDIIESPDVWLNFRAEMGTARYTVIQTNLKNMLSEDWIYVGDYLKEYLIAYEYEITKSGMESLIQIKKSPIRFACDGIV